MTDLKKRIHELRGHCVHGFQKRTSRDGLTDKHACIYCSEVFFVVNNENEPVPSAIPDYLDDPAATLGAVIELVLAGWLFGWRCGEFTWNDSIFHKVRIANPNETIAIWTAWCELKESA